MNLNLFIFFGSIALGLLALYVLKGEGAIRKLSGIFLLILSIGGGIKSTVFQVDEGELMVVTQFKKIHTTITTPGIHFRFPWMEVFTFPKRLNSFTEEIEGRSLDGLVIKFEITPFIKVDESNLENIYRDIAKSYEDMQEKIILPAIRNITRSTVSTFNASDIYDKRVDMAKKLESDAREYLKTRHVILEELQLRKIIFPETIEKAIQMKLQKQQEAEAIEFDKLKAQKQAEVREIEARGMAKSQEIINSTLSARYLQLEAIKTYGELAKNPNKTFIITPTDGKSTGMPMVLSGS